MDDLETIDASQLGKLIGRSTKSIKLDASRKPHTLPPRFIIPGTRNLRWRVVDVRRWMEALVEVAEAERIERRKLAVRAGIKYDGKRPNLGHLGTKRNGAAATAQLAKKETTQ